MKRFITILDRASILIPLIVVAVLAILYTLANEMWTMFAIVDLGIVIAVGIHSEVSHYNRIRHHEED